MQPTGGLLGSVGLWWGNRLAANSCSQSVLQLPKLAGEAGILRPPNDVLSL